MYKEIEDFISTIIADGKSECTIRAYRYDLDEFAEFCKENCYETFAEIKYSDLRCWSNNLEKKGLSAQTRARKVSTIRSFFKYLSKMDYISGKNPADSLEAPKLPKKQPKVISVQKSRALLDFEQENETDKVTWFRDYAIIATFLFTGIRREELTNIKLKDIDLEMNTILIHGKGNKERTVYIGENLHAILSEYLRSYRILLRPAKESVYLFPSIKNPKLCVGSVNNIVNKALKGVGIKEEGVSVHILRKRFATTVFANTKDIATTSKLLGHSSPTVTMRYVLIDENTMRNAANAVSF